MKIIKLLFTLVWFILIHDSIWAQSTDNLHACIPCEQMKNLRIPDVIIAKSAKLEDPVPHCLISGTIGAEINFEVALPEGWNSRFVMYGNGGFAGSIQTGHSKIRDGYATAGTDTGHKGETIKGDWALNNLERQVNFGHLAIHRTTVTAKEIIRQYYCSEIVRSYFQGCSRGGGQAMMEAQRYPQDFDGIVAGAPGFNWPEFAAEFVKNIQAVYPNQKALKHPVITLSNLDLLESLVLEQCDELDGLNDFIINDPRECNINFASLPTCPDNKASEDCFTSEQIEAIKIIYDGVTDNGFEIYPGFPFGCENEEWGWKNWITGPTNGPLALDFPSLQYGFGTEIFKYLVFNDPNWDYSSYEFKDFSQTTAVASSYLNATATDYSEFKKRGGKMLMYHGWNDHALSALATIIHYEQVKEEDPGLHDYFRLFLLPGVLHCGGGPGPSQVDWLEIVRDWVENKTPPERVVLSKSEGDQVIMTRPVFPYPKKAIYRGQGDPNQESSFTTTE